MVISAKLHPDIITKFEKHFNETERYRILNHSLSLMMQIEKADLKYILFNNFTNLSHFDFFKPQDILRGRSIAQISLGDPNSIQIGLRNLNTSAIHNI